GGGQVADQEGEQQAGEDGRQPGGRRMLAPQGDQGQGGEGDGAHSGGQPVAPVGEVKGVGSGDEGYGPQRDQPGAQVDRVPERYGLDGNAPPPAQEGEDETGEQLHQDFLPRPQPEVLPGQHFADVVHQDEP